MRRLRACLGGLYLKLSIKYGTYFSYEFMYIQNKSHNHIFNAYFKNKLLQKCSKSTTARRDTGLTGTATLLRGYKQIKIAII